MAINYVHPSVSSTITDNSTTYITASGTTKLFAVFTSEKGVDNEIKTITSVSEFEFNYGKPNMKLYGQTAYNIVNWLNAGGVVYCLRVLPEDAGYANAIVNIQTKTSKKEIVDGNGNTIEIDGVELRPCVTYIETFKDRSINFSDIGASNQDTVDGYKNNMLFAVIPKGRGNGYNNLGFRITMTNAYDSTYEFRLYNFEVTMTSDSGNTSTIQGPFLVSLDPDAMSNSGSSLFIVDVIDRYCDYFTIIFNEKNYVKLAETINPYVHPNNIDFFEAESRLIDGEYETYDDPEFGTQDVHVRVNKIVDANSKIETEITKVDNDYRAKQTKRLEDSFDRLKKALNAVRKNSIESFKNIKLDSGITLSSGSADLTSAKEAVNALYTELKTYTGVEEFTEETYSNANLSMTNLSNSVDSLINKLYEVYDYAKIYSDTSDILTDLMSIESAIEVINISSKNCNRYKVLVSELLTTLNNLVNNGTDSEKEEFFNSVIYNTNEILDVLESITDSENKFADKKLDEVKEYLNYITECYNTLTYKFVTYEEYEASMKDGLNTIDNLLSNSSLVFAINLALLEKKYSVYSDNEDTLYNTVDAVIASIENTITNFSRIEYSSVETAVETAQSDLNQGKLNSYTTFLQNYDSFIGLRNGTDGSIEGKRYYESDVEALIIRGYKGNIDVSLKDKDQWPIDMVLDANYSASVKNAIISLCTEYRDDFIGILDTGDTATPDDAIKYRKNSLGVNNFRLAIFTQNFTVADTEYTGNNIEVTPTYFLASKIPANDNNIGIHWNFVGPRRGTISGFKSISFLPNPEWREKLYNSQVNYVQQDQVSTRFGSQLTSQMTVSALSNISCVRTLLRIQRDVEDLMKNYQFEFNDDVTITNAQTSLNSYLNQWISNRACDSISGTVYASDYDRQQKLLRVKIELVFNSIIERIAIDLIVNA